MEHVHRHTTSHEQHIMDIVVAQVEVAIVVAVHVGNDVPSCVINGMEAAPAACKESL